MPPRSPDQGEAARDRAACAAILRDGSKSFHAASRLLPSRLRAPITAFYAYCRIADDAIDLAGARGRSASDALSELHHDLDALYAGAPRAHAVHRELARAVAAHRLPRVLFDALLEGFAWDVEARRYESLDDVCAYAARVAGTVGVVMALLMDRRAPATLARAADLGVAMQLTNIARDVGEDARNGRVYLPLAWLRDAGLDAGELLRAPRFSPALGRVVERLLAEAGHLYTRADLGIAALPSDCRIAIRAARFLYADIGRSIARARHDSVSTRHSTTPLRKLFLVGAALRASLPFTPSSPSGPSSAAAPPLEATRFLVEAVHP